MKLATVAYCEWKPQELREIWVPGNSFLSATQPRVIPYITAAGEIRDI